MKKEVNVYETHQATPEPINSFEELPILPLRDSVLFPNAVLPLAIGRERSVRLVEQAMGADKTIGVVAQRDPGVEDPKALDLHQIGTAASILRMFRLPTGGLNIIVQGLYRFKIDEVVQTEPFLQAKVRIMRPEPGEQDVEVEALFRNVIHLFQRIVALSHSLPDELQGVTSNTTDPEEAIDFIAANLPSLSTAAKQEILETLDLKARLRLLLSLLTKELQVAELGSKIQSQVQSEVGKTQREYYLREQLKAIQRELGETDERTQEIDELRQKIEAAGMLEEAKKEALRELDRLAKIPPQAAEYTVSRTYLDWLIALPWSKETTEEIDLLKARGVLDEDHYGLEKVKERILEYLAVRKLNPKTRNPILCFVGPPGVGKTSLGRSIAKALGRRFVRISLGGMRDEAEIRGHRRTYIGSLPGQIIQGIRRAETKNPVFMLDEVDKLGMDFRGDPASALLEVLDPEQNHAFRDHYIDLPFDLSKVLFICTANILDPVPPALRDRMEVIELPGYTEAEKLEIAKRHLIPKQAHEHGLNLHGQIIFADLAVVKLIREYTREAGLRNLEREIASIFRKVTKKVAEGKDEPVEVTPELVEGFLGAPRFFAEEAKSRVQVPGVAIGLAWTPAGGDLLFIEATKMKGGKTLTLTGHLGEVMKESAQAAISWVRAHAKDLGIDENFYSEYDIHLHVPEGAIPKDGPSAGITMVVTLVSLLTGRKVREVAMTGEITLSGQILPVGGIKEKVLAARRAGIQEVILPERNRKNLMEDIPEAIRRGMTFHLVNRIEDALSIALYGTKERPFERLDEFIEDEKPVLVG
ncbi:MAG: endopeptidase La [candidate division NC10 bacterium]|nr:endopeptidase La [candidate division NC10 bacterium]